MDRTKLFAALAVSAALLCLCGCGAGNINAAEEPLPAGRDVPADNADTADPDFAEDIETTVFDDG
ncbi:MAG: hemin receptor, partial [Firmicutes bacterium]|nr:hemin receptor [Bacillota bacterium]